MELVKDIYFNTDKLVENTNVKVSYTGKFYQDNTEKVFLHYGYGKDWNNLNEIEMNKTDLGYQAELNLAGKDTINFCFKNQNNEWDNNFGNNYIFEIEKENQPIAESKGNVNVFWGTQINNTNKTNAIKGNNDNCEPTVKKIDAIFGDNSFKYTNELGTVDITASALNPNPIKDTAVTQKVEIPFVGPCSNKTVNGGTTTINGSVKATASTTSNVTPNASNNDFNGTNSANKFTPTSLAFAPTGFEYWSKKIKHTVCSFFSNVPKFISGNYKRLMDKTSK